MATNHPNAPRNDSQPPKPPPAPAPDRPMPKERAEYLASTYGYTPEQINVVRNAICIGATDAELEFFLATAKRVQLDPFARQIWFVKRRQKIEDSQGNEQWVDVGRPETSIDGFRTIAERTGEYEGQAPFEWCNRKGDWVSVWLDENEPPRAARATVFRKGMREPMVAIALYREFCPVYKNGNSPAMWKKMPANQLSKCAESLAFRRAFPRDLSGMMTDTEMEHVAADSAAAYTAPPKQIEQRKPDAAALIIDTTAVTDTRETVPASTSASQAAEPATEQAAPPVEDEGATDLDLEIVRLMKLVGAAKVRDDLQEVGRIIVDAKKSRAKTADDAHANAVIEVVEPALQKRWRELAPKKGATP